MSKISKTPLHDIDDGNYFQQIVAEYFRSLKREKQDFHIADIDVDDAGIGCDNGCDILVDFHFEDAIGKHTHRWVVECKSQKKAVGSRDINSENLGLILDNKDANGYLLVCVSDASTSLKQLLNNNKRVKSVVWNGTQLWHKLIGSKKIIQSFFPEYYKTYFEENRAIERFDDAFSKFSKQLEK